MILLPFCFQSTDDSTPILLAFYWWFYSHSTCILLMILLPFYWWFNSHSTRILLMILLPFRFHSADDSTSILLAFYWWFYCRSTCILLMILLPFYLHSASVLLFYCWLYSHCSGVSTPILLMIPFPFDSTLYNSSQKNGSRISSRRVVEYSVEWEQNDQ